MMQHYFGWRIRILVHFLLRNLILSDISSRTITNKSLRTRTFYNPISFKPFKHRSFICKEQRIVWKQISKHFYAEISVKISSLVKNWLISINMESRSWKKNELTHWEKNIRLQHTERITGSAPRINGKRIQQLGRWALVSLLYIYTLAGTARPSKSRHCRLLADWRLSREDNTLLAQHNKHHPGQPSPLYVCINFQSCLVNSCARLLRRKI